PRLSEESPPMARIILGTLSRLRWTRLPHDRMKIFFRVRLPSRMFASYVIGGLPHRIGVFSLGGLKVSHQLGVTLFKHVQRGFPAVLLRKLLVEFRHHVFC